MTSLWPVLKRPSQCTDPPPSPPLCGCAGAVSSTPGDVTTASQEPHHNSKRKVHAQLADFFSKQPLSWRQAQELPCHLLMAGDLQGLLTYLTHSRSVGGW